MPSWKKVVVSGSDASLASIYTSSHITGSANVSSSLASTGSFGRMEATTFAGDGSGLTGVTADVAYIAISEDGTELTPTVSNINFVGDVINATNVGNDVEVTVTTTGISLQAAFDDDEDGNLMPTSESDLVEVFWMIDPEDSDNMQPRHVTG